MITVNIYDAKTNLSEYLKKVAQGEEIIMLKNNEPITKLVTK